MKIGIRVTGAGFAHAEALVADLRRRILGRLAERAAERARASAMERRVDNADPVRRVTPPARR